MFGRAGRVGGFEQAQAGEGVESNCREVFYLYIVVCVHVECDFGA